MVSGLARILLVGLAVLLAAAPAKADCSGQFPSGYICGNIGSAQAPPTGNPLSGQLDTAFGNPAPVGSVLNRGSSLWSATVNPVLGNPGSSVGSLGFANATSGTIVLEAVTGALGSSIATLPANTGTIAETNLSQNWSAAQAFAAISATTGTFSAAISATAATFSSTLTLSNLGATAQCLEANSSNQVLGAGKACGTVSSVGESFTGGLISVSGSPITSSGTLALTVAGTSGGIPYFSSSSAWASSAALAAGAIVVGGGAGTAPSTSGGITTTAAISAGTAGQLFVEGTASSVSLGGTGTGAIYLASANGLSLQGNGSTYDVVLNDSSGSVACGVLHGTTTINCDSIEATQSSNATVTSYFSNTNTGGSSAQVLGVGNNTSNTEFSITVNGSGNSSGNGDNSATMTAAGGLWIQGEGTNALKFGASGAITVYNQSTSVTPAYAVCAASGANGTGGGQIDLDTSSTVCGLSSMRFKRNIAAFDIAGTAKLLSLASPSIMAHFSDHLAYGDLLAEVMALVPAQFRGDGEHIPDTDLQLGLTAENACHVDERICARFDDGTPRTFKPNAVIALLVAVVQRQQWEIQALEQRLPPQ